MWNAEEDFPRGGKLKQKNSETQDEENDDLELTEPTTNAKANKQNKQSGLSGEKQRKRKRQDDDSAKPLSSSKKVKRESTGVKVHVDVPLQQCLSSDLCVLGCVREAHDYSVSVSLPGNHVASLPITEISPAYTQQLHKVAQATEEDTEDVVGVDEMFQPGQLVSVVVNSVQDDTQRGKTVVKLSSAPARINSSLPLTAITDGLLLFGSVSSVEDHGYRVDLGIKNLQAFLTSKDSHQYVKKYFNGERLSVGQTLWCVLTMKGKSGITTGETRTVNVSVDPVLVQQAKLQEMTSVNSVLPGMKVKAVVEKRAETGLVVKVDNFEAVIHASQLPKSPLNYKAKSQIETRVLYVDPVSKILQLTALPAFVSFYGGPVDLFQDLKIGNILEAKVLRSDKKKGVHFSLPDGVTAFAALSKLSDKSEKPDLSSYKAGESHKCRILGFNFMEAVALITLKPSILSQKFLTLDDINVGDVVQGTVQEVMSNGISVKLSKGIYSFIPGTHLADVPIKHPEKKFTVGGIIKCRVLKKLKSRVMLTHKKSLVRGKHTIITDYSQLRPQMELEGFIIAVKERVVIVSFFGDVKGFVMTQDMSTEVVNDPSTMFYVGQVIRCRVVRFDVDQKKLKLSFNFGKQKKQKANAAVDCTDESDFQLGMVVGAKVVQEDKEGFSLLLDSGQRALLPFSHLSDYQEVTELRKMGLTQRQRLDRVTYFCRRKQAIVTMKESFLQAAHDKEVFGEFSELKMGQLLPAVVKNHETYGLFLELAGGHTGLCPARTLTRLQPQSLVDLFQPGQSVITRLAKIDEEKKRFLGSLLVDEVYEGGLEAPLGLLENYLKSRQQALDVLYNQHDDLSCYSDLQVGHIVEVQVSSVFKKGILGELPSGAKALATKYHFGGVEPTEGSSYQAVVLFVDPLTPCVELSLDPKLVKAVSKRKDNVKTQLKAEQVLKADVLLVKAEFVLMGLRGHGAGKFVYVPARKHMNDVEVNTMFKIGAFTDVCLKQSCCGHQLAVLLMHDPIHKAKLEAEAMKKKQARHSTKPGTFLDAQVKTVHPLQMNIMAGNLHGRVHICEAADDLTQGKNPLKKFHPNQKFKVRVIGLRDVKSKSYLTVTKPKPNKTLLECTLKQSKLESESEDQLIEEIHANVGEAIWVFVIQVLKDKVWVQVSLTQQGYISMFHLSQDMEIVNNPEQHFAPGQALLATVVTKGREDKMELSLIDADPQLKVGQTVTAQITSLLKDGAESCLNVKLYGGRLGRVSTRPSSQHCVGQYVRCGVLTICKETVTLSLEDRQGQKKRKRKSSLSDDLKISPEKPLQKERQKKKSEKKKKQGQEQKDSGVEVTSSSSENEKENQDILALSVPGFSWDGVLPTEHAEPDTVAEQDDDDDDNTVAPDSVKSKKKKKREEEKLIQEYERTQSEGNVAPATQADYERLVLQSPHSSLVWLRYMTHHVELAELEKARVVAERALSTISHREEQERQNVWLGYLSVETQYGEQTAVKAVLDRAVQNCEPINIYLGQCNIYVTADKIEEAEHLYMLMSRKLKKDKRVWKSYAQFLYKAGRLEAARALLNRAITVLEKRDHVEVITRFATLEFSQGEGERGRTMFENLTASYPGRTDIWSVYVDMVTNTGDIDGARHILQRAVKLKLNSKKLSFLLHKFVKFEETHGTEEQVQQAKDMVESVMAG